ncbi:MAG: undecaprenyl/decaprenyl-phosphate alpha-N-acetylglucosaminyl 1-phosphate transferase [Lewinellaceae bacterium]|nr:undecaprenyl/decaprenyl-phosphate alpha-N-acetylglucosaminyl 1-phosphate transferase [Lewinellaceae bacterium]
MLASLFGFITSFVLTYLAIPPIIRVSREKKLYDRPNARSAHEEPTPSLGGIAIFAGMICGITLWAPAALFGDLQYILAALLVIFLLGVRDDLVPLPPVKKLLVQVLVALILIYKSHVKITSLEGIAGVFDLPEVVALVLSVIAIVGIVNAFNLIDGINGLAGSTGLLASLIFGTWFFATGHIEFAVPAASLAGALAAFLRFNFSPAQIFMGDAGAMLIGTVCAVLALKFIEVNRALPVDAPLHFDAGPAIAIAALILPLFDTLRVIIRRLLHGKSPFYPDRSHVHHFMLDAGLTHSRATVILVAVSAFFVAGAVLFHAWGNTLLLLIEITLALLLSYWLRRMAK